MSRRRCWLLLAAALQPAFLALAASPVVITQMGRAFSAREVRVKRGDVLRFNNADEFIHQVFVRSASFNFTSNEQEPGRALDVQFPLAGRFDVRCEIHPKMLLTVSVE